MGDKVYGFRSSRSTLAVVNVISQVIVVTFDVNIKSDCLRYLKKLPVMTYRDEFTESSNTFSQEFP